MDLLLMGVLGLLGRGFCSSKYDVFTILSFVRWEDIAGGR